MGANRFSWDTIESDYGAGQASALQAARMKYDMNGEGLSKVINDYTNKEERLTTANNAATSAGNTADIIEQIRAGKTPERTGMYDAGAISDAKYGYEKDQQSLAFKRAAEGRAAAAHKLRMAGGSGGSGSAYSPELAKAYSVYSDAVASKDPIKIRAARDGIISIKGGAEAYQRQFSYFKKDNTEAVNSAKKEAEAKDFMEALKPPVVTPTAAGKPIVTNEVPTDLITPAVENYAVAAVDGNTIPTEDMSNSTLMTIAADHTEKNIGYNNPARGDAFKHTASNVISGDSFIPEVSNKDINTTVSTPIDTPVKKVTARDLADPKIQEKAREKVAAFTTDRIDEKYRTSTKAFEDGVKEGKLTISANNAKIKAAQKEYSRLDAIPMPFEKGSKQWGMMNQAKNEQSNIIAMANTENTNISSSIENAHTTRKSNLKEYKNQYTETRSNEVDAILAGPGTYKKKRNKVSEFMKIQRDAIPRDQQWKREIIQSIVAKSVGSKEYRGLIKDEGSGAGNRLGGKVVKTTAGMETEPFFDKFRGNSMRDLTDVGRLVINEYGEMNLKVLEEAIEASDSYDDNDYTFFDPDGGKVKSIDTGWGHGSKKAFEAQVMEHYKKVMNRSDDFKVKKANDGKKKATIENQLRARIKTLESMNKK